MIGSFVSRRWGWVRVERGTYLSADGPLALYLLCEDGEPLAALSVNMYRPACSEDSRELPANCFYLKTWGGNEELAREALDAGLYKLRPDLPTACSGYVQAPAAELLANANPEDTP